MPRKKNIGNQVEHEVVRMKLSELTPASYNPRKMSVEAYQGLGKSIERFGLLMPIVWNKRSGNIVGGHQRVRYLQEKGETETDVMVVDLNDNDEVALNVTLNNRMIRGDFTSSVVGLLEKTQSQLGDAFREVGLGNLLRDSERKFRKELSGGEPPQPSPEPPIPPPQVPQEPDAIITCPECKSRFKMKNNEVVFNAVEGKK